MTSPDVLPSTARELKERLVRIFPGFSRDCTDEDLAEAEREGWATFHFVLQPFTSYFGTGRETFSRRQLEEYAALVNRALERDDDLENAFSTCFLEHVRQIRSYSMLSPFLSDLAKRRTHA